MKKTLFAVFVVLLTVTVCACFVGCSLFGGDAVGIKCIEKTATEGLVDTYTITLTDGTTSTFTVTNGQGTNQLPSDTYTPEQYFRFELLDDDTYAVKKRYYDMYSIVVIPSEHNGKAVTTLRDGAFDSMMGVDELVISTNITYIGKEAFSTRDDFQVELNYKGTKMQWDAIEKDDKWDRGKYVRVVHCTDGDIVLE